MKEEIEQNKLLSNKHNEVCTPLEYIEYFLFFVSTVTGCISTFASLLGISIGIATAAIVLKV